MHSLRTAQYFIVAIAAVFAALHLVFTGIAMLFFNFLRFSPDADPDENLFDPILLIIIPAAVACLLLLEIPRSLLAAKKSECNEQSSDL